MMIDFSLKLVNWYQKNHRKLPWRETTNPYLIWVSEIILQQTQILTGKDYYLRITTRFPNLESLAQATEDELMQLWQGLGYYSRARNMHNTAKELMTRYNGTFPTTYHDLLKLKGIGTYTAAAIASFAYNLPHAVVDGNVYRVYSRLFGINTPIDTSSGKKEFEALANRLLQPSSAALHNQAIMELGALVCKPKSPSCQACPFENECIANRNQTIDLYPVKTKRTRQRERYFLYLVFLIKDQLFIEKREGRDIWKNLYQFPLVEFQSPITDTEAKARIENILGKQIVSGKFSLSTPIKHVLSHQILNTRFALIHYLNNTHPALEQFPGAFLVDINQLHHYAFPQLIRTYLHQHISF
jgi:A/G-specific adenine glycosylase